jgi:hypothetical protein
MTFAATNSFYSILGLAGADPVGRRSQAILGLLCSAPHKKALCGHLAYVALS